MVELGLLCCCAGDMSESEACVEVEVKILVLERLSLMPRGGPSSLKSLMKASRSS
jgi:hypothetical protein